MRFTLTVLSLFACFSLVSCTKSAAPSVPDTPDGTVQAVAQSLSEKQPGVVWEAMPASYQKDVEGLIQTFADKMDKEVYDKAFAVTGKLTKLLKQKKDLIISHPMVKQGQVKTEELKKNWDALVEFLTTLTSSEIKSLESLKTLDVGKFLAGTGRKLMQKASAISKTAPEDKMGNELEKLSNLKVEVLESGEGESKLRITAPDEAPKEVELVKVEGKWVPKDLADGWADSMKKARKDLEKFDPSENKTKIMNVLTGLEDTIDGLLGATTQEEFNQLAQKAVAQVFSGLARGMSPKPGASVFPKPGAKLTPPRPK